MKATVYVGDALSRLREMPDESVHCVVTSPPYWGLRDYGVAGQLGLETDPFVFIERMVEVFREVRRVLRSDGVCWVNMGDSYAASPGQRKTTDKAGPKQVTNGGSIGSPSRSPEGFKPKDLVGIPWRLAFAMQGDGWWLRGDHVWGKPNGMPESVTDRPTRSHEYVFLFTKSERYWYDAEAVRTAPKASTETRLKQDIDSQNGSLRANGGAKTNGPMKAVGRQTDKQRGHSRRHAGFNDRWDAMSVYDQMKNGANLRSIWWISPAQYEEAHFAVMPEKVAEICIRAGCPQGGIVLDPFTGSGTTGVVSMLCQSNFIGIELNPEYAEMAKHRIGEVSPMFAEVDLVA